VIGLSELWLPILVSAIAVFLVSSLIHMLLPWHNDEYPKVPDEDGVLEALGPMNIPPGDYMVPRAAGQADMGGAEFTEKLKKGPVLLMTVLPNGPVNMGRNLGLWFGYSLVVGLFAAYVAGEALPAGSEYLAVFRYTGTVAFAGYSLALWQMWVWYNRSLKTTIKSTIDGLAYALVTAGVFGWMWP
jgi:hypothetical protein